MNIIEPAGDFDFELTYYLAGPMSGLPELNFPAFDKAAKDLREGGVKVLSPHEIDHGETPDTRGSLAYQVYLAAGFKLLLQCQGLIVLPGWANSWGSGKEMMIAGWLQFPRYLYGDDFLLRIKNR